MEGQLYFATIDGHDAWNTIGSYARENGINRLGDGSLSIGEVQVRYHNMRLPSSPEYKPVVYAIGRDSKAVTSVARLIAKHANTEPSETFKVEHADIGAKLE